MCRYSMVDCSFPQQISSLAPTTGVSTIVEWSVISSYYLSDYHIIFCHRAVGSSEAS